MSAGSERKTVVLTGANGFIGRHCITALLDRGFSVHAVASKVSDELSPDVQWHEVDLLDLTSISGLFQKTQPTHLLHLAWYLKPGRWADSDLNFSWVQSSLEMVKHFNMSGGRRIAIAGTNHEYDWDYGYCHEFRTPLVYASPYGSCKNALKILIEEYSKLHHLSMAWPRIFDLFGPHEHPDRLVPSVIRALLRDKEAKCTQGRQIRDYLFVRDVADALVTLLDCELEGPVNIGSGQPVSVAQIVQAVGQLLKKEHLLRLGALPVRSGDRPLVVADVERLTTAVGWRPRYTLNEGLDLTIDWWRTHLQGGN